jgi:hypothetical protein
MLNNLVKIQTNFIILNKMNAAKNQPSFTLGTFNNQAPRDASPISPFPRGGAPSLQGLYGGP